MRSGSRSNHFRPLPAGWHWATLGDYLIDVQPGLACGRKSLTVGVPHLRMNNVSAGGEIDLSLLWRIPVSDTALQRYRVKQEDVLFNNTNSIELVGKTALFQQEQGDFVYSNHLTRLRTRQDELRPGWLAYYLRFLWQRRYFEQRADRWVGQSAVRDDVLRQIPLPLPPRLEQEALVSRLEAQMAKVARMRRAVEWQREAANVVIQSARSKILFPLWEDPTNRQRLGDVLQSCQYGSSVKANGDGRGLPMLRMVNLQDGDIEYRNLVHVELSNAELAKYRLENGDVLINRTNSADLVGKAALFTREDHFVFASYLIRLKFEPAKCLPSYATEFINSPLGRAYIDEVKRQSISQANINTQEIRRMPITVPPIEIQRQSVAAIHAVRQIARSVQDAAARQLEAIQALPGALLREVFGGFEPPRE